MSRLLTSGGKSEDKNDDKKNHFIHFQLSILFDKSML